ncbi:MAG: 4-hydroxy-tetrahydrodipicolinate synthase, partial [Planctomycetes bacterium]|nr:4-hydroxy-tetrahydrodipicolinate synthase [Planctomycetota bacterium]
MTALVTPFHNGEVAWDTFDRLVDRQIAGGTSWLVPCGTTGESPTLTDSEHDRMIEAVVQRAGGRVRVMAGTGSNCTAEAIRRTQRAASIGANAALVVAPYYNRPTAEGLYRHFAAIAESADIPIVLYNVPVRTGVNISNDVVVRLRNAYPRIVAIKHATGSVDGVTDLLSRCDITVLSGDDALTFPLMCLGARGVISVVANLRPSVVHSLVQAVMKGELTAAAKHHRALCLLAEGLGRFGPNPLPIKTAMAIAGLLSEEFRLPLCPLDADARTGVEELLRRHEIIEATPRERHEHHER